MSSSVSRYIKIPSRSSEERESSGAAVRCLAD